MRTRFGIKPQKYLQKKKKKNSKLFKMNDLKLLIENIVDTRRNFFIWKLKMSISLNIYVNRLKNKYFENVENSSYRLIRECRELA